MTFLKNYKVAGESTRCATSTSTSTTAPLLRRSLNIFVHITLRIREPSLPPWPALATLTYVDPASAKASREKFNNMQINMKPSAAAALDQFA